MLQKALRTASQNPKWENNVEDIKLVASYAKTLSEGKEKLFISYSNQDLLDSNIFVLYNMQVVFLLLYIRF